MRCGNCGAASICKEIENLDGAAGVFYFPLYYRREPVPVYCLFGKEPGVFEAEGLKVEMKVVVADLPFVRQIMEFPFAAAFFTAVVMTVRLIPAVFISLGVPDDLRVGTDEDIFSPAFELFTF